MSAMLAWYEIGVLSYSKSKKRANTYVSPGVSDVVVGGEYGISHVPPKNKVKIDVKPQGFLRTIFRQAKDHARAMKKGERVGTVQYCRKVDASFYFQKIEYLNLRQKPLAVEIKTEDLFILNEQNELTLTQQKTKDELEKKYEIEVEY